MSSQTSVDLSLEDQELVILGTEYAGEMKKGVFTVANYLGPKRGILSMHCSATADRLTGRSSLLFGLSGTGKTTLSADPKRHLIGDDEHCWSNEGIFNIEGGCYAKAINLSPETEPDIFQALRFGAVLENVVLDEERLVDYTDVSLTENTRGAYPIEFIQNARIPCIAGHPTEIIFLTCDAFGVLPPVSLLAPAQAMYHFISGYTAKVAGTEVGVTEPSATFSPCFGGPFLVWHPSKYAELLATRIRLHNTRVWLVNTGWSGGGYGVGKRIKLAYAPLWTAFTTEPWHVLRRALTRYLDLTLSRNVPVYPRNFSSRAKRGPTSRLTTPARKSSRNCSTRTSKNTRRAWTPRSKRLRR
jgi:phosphoenolpyruvate carboxykinase (ATP)